MIRIRRTWHGHGIERRRGRQAALAALAATCALLSQAVLLQPLTPDPWALPRGAAPTEYEIKAAYLYNFARFVEWTANATSVQAGSFELCVLGKDPFGPALYQTIAGESIGGKYVVAKGVSSPQDAADCREVFISSSEDSQLAEILPALDEASVLTVSDLPEFAERGGMIGLVSENHRVRFEVNLTAARRAGLTFSSQLLKVATKVIGVPEQAAEK